MTPTEPQPDEAADIRPIVAPPASNRAPWIFAGVLVVGGVLLFNALEERRQAISAPSIAAAPDPGRASIASPPELVIPPQPAPAAGYYYDGSQPPVVLQRVAPAAVIPERGGTPRPPSVASPAATLPGMSKALPAPVAGTTSPWPSYQSPAPGGGDRAVPATGSSGLPERVTPESGKERVAARRFANPATTVPKGTVVQAVLESALDSTRGGFARAIVSRDVYSFDGSRVLIQRGSRIIGEYKSDVSLGQKRMLIQWQRLMRPDGVMIDLDSPSADPLGRAGLQGSVNTHFFERFAGAILQSTLDIGVQLAARAASRDTYILALPGSAQQATQALQPERIPPTVKVRQGSSVSVFVARDLDFTEVGG